MIALLGVCACVIALVLLHAPRPKPPDQWRRYRGIMRLRDRRREPLDLWRWRGRS